MKFHHCSDLLERVKETGFSIGEIALQREIEKSEKTREEVLARMQEALSAMKESAAEGLKSAKLSPSGLSGGDAMKMKKAKLHLLNPLTADAIAIGLAVNETSAAQGKIVACPTAGSCGILPGAVLAYSKHYKVDDERVCMALFAAGAIGQIIEENACIAGAEGGCQAECGSAAAMAAAAIVDLAGGGAEEMLQAAALALKNLLGLACDPVAGLVEVPCVKRNGVLAAFSLIAAEMALAGIQSKIPVDEVIDAMYQIGRMMPSAIRETAEGGLATTPTGLQWKEKLFEY